MTEAKAKYVPHFWNVLTQEEKLKYYKDLGNRILEHRYRYYVQDDAVLEDWIYDELERSYKDIASALGLPDSAIDMVGWDSSKPGAGEAAVKVKLGVDHYAVTQRGLEEVWERLGPPRYAKKSEAK